MGALVSSPETCMEAGSGFCAHLGGLGGIGPRVFSDFSSAMIVINYDGTRLSHTDVSYGIKWRTQSIHITKSGTES